MTKFKTKICEECGKEFEPTNNIQKYCVYCREIVYERKRKEYLKEYYEKNKEKILLQTHEYRKNNIDTIKEYKQKYKIEKKRISSKNK